MSGTFKSSVNNYWDCSYNSIAPSVMFWMWINFVNNHSGLDFKGYGTGKTSSGTTPPSAWRTWDPFTNGTPPMSDNSWFVFEAVNADNALDGGGNNPWQAKVQFTNATAFDDCNVADTDYGEEGTTYICCMRVSPGAGWDNVTALDFAPSGGEDISDNYGLIRETLDGKFVLDIVGDDDTILWAGACFDGDLVTESGSRARCGHLGILVRRSSNVDYPFFFMSKRLEDTTLNRLECNGSTFFPGTRPSNIIPYDTFSLWNDGTKVERHRLHHWDDKARTWLTKDANTGGDNTLGCLLCPEDNTGNRYGILGELRFLGATGNYYDQGALVGDDSDWKQICYNALTYQGMLMRWPAGTSPIWP